MVTICCSSSRCYNSTTHSQIPWGLIPGQVVGSHVAILRFVRKGASSWESDHGGDLEGNGEESSCAMYGHLEARIWMVWKQSSQSAAVADGLLKFTNIQICGFRRSSQSG